MGSLSLVFKTEQCAILYDCVLFTLWCLTVLHCGQRNQAPLCWEPEALEGSPFKAWGRLEYSCACFTFASNFFLSNFYLPGSFNFIFKKKNSSYFFLVSGVSLQAHLHVVGMLRLICLWHKPTKLAHSYQFCPLNGGRGCLMSPLCLKSQGCQLIPLCYLLSCSSA